MALDDDVRNLARNPTLAALDSDALRQLAVSAETRILRDGEVLFRRDEPSDGGYVIVSGAIALAPNDLGQKSDPSARVVRAPTLIGDMALITKTRRPVTAIACEPTAVLKISRQLFHRVLNDSPRSAERLKHMLSERLLNFLQELEGAVQGGV
jgi:CRP-like cAMP-binding protein